MSAILNFMLTFSFHHFFIERAGKQSVVFPGAKGAFGNGNIQPCVGVRLFQVRQRNAVAAKSGQQSAPADGTVRKQAQSILPLRFNTAFGKSFSMQKLPNARRHEGVGKNAADKDDRLSCKTVAQMVAGVENPFTLCGAAGGVHCDRAVVGFGGMPCAKQKHQPDQPIGGKGEGEDKGDADVKIHRTKAAKKAGGMDQQRNSQHQPGKNKIDQQKNKEPFDKSAQTGKAVGDPADQDAYPDAQKDAQWNRQIRKQDQGVDAAQQGGGKNAQSMYLKMQQKIAAQQQEVGDKGVDENQRIGVDRDRQDGSPPWICFHYSAAQGEFMSLSGVDLLEFRWNLHFSIDRNVKNY